MSCPSTLMFRTILTVQLTIPKTGPKTQTMMIEKNVKYGCESPNLLKHNPTHNVSIFYPIEFYNVPLTIMSLMPILICRKVNLFTIKVSNFAEMSLSLCVTMVVMRYM